MWRSTAARGSGRVEQPADQVRQNGATIYIRDVAHVRDGYPPQTNIVRADGMRGSLMSVYKNGNVSTLDIVAGVRNLLPLILTTRAARIADQADRRSVDLRARFHQRRGARSHYRRLSDRPHDSVFLGSWRSTIIIAVSIPLSILCSIFALSALGETINIMTLGGLALAVGILVDDATVEIENINRNLEMGKEIEQAILDGAAQIAIPAFVSTLSICIVFVPMFFLAGVARYLFVPLAEAVSFAMLASYLLSRTIVPTMAKYLLKGHAHHEHERSAIPSRRLQLALRTGFEKLRLRYQSHCWKACVRNRHLRHVFPAVLSASSRSCPGWDRTSSRLWTAGKCKLHLRAQTGTRIEETAKLFDLVERRIRQLIPPSELENVLDNIGLPYSSINTSYSNSGTIGPADARYPDFALRESSAHGGLRRQAAAAASRANFPGTLFYFLPADMVSQILNFGLPAPIDIQVRGPATMEANRDFRRPNCCSR